VFVTAVLLLAAVAFGAGWLPARRASRTQPMMALRYD
jgi:ABC-type lipoprotein release transport system permease subunit